VRLQSSKVHTKKNTPKPQKRSLTLETIAFTNPILLVLFMASTSGTTSLHSLNTVVSKSAARNASCHRKIRNGGKGGHQEANMMGYVDGWRGFQAISRNAQI